MQNPFSTTKEELIAELKMQQNHADSVDEWEEIERQISELEMQYEDEDGNMQWL